MPLDVESVKLQVYANFTQGYGWGWWGKKTFLSSLNFVNSFIENSPSALENKHFHVTYPPERVHPVFAFCWGLCFKLEIVPFNFG